MNQPGATISVLCTLGIARLVEPIEQSAPFMFWDDGPEIVAVFPAGPLLALAETDLGEGDFYREVVPCNTEIPWDEDAITGEGGVWGYLQSCFGISTEKNRAIAIHELAEREGVSPVEIGNRIARLHPAPAAARTDA